MMTSQAREGKQAKTMCRACVMQGTLNVPAVIIVDRFGYCDSHHNN